MSWLQIHQAISAWFLGPCAENFSVAQELFQGVLEDQQAVRVAYHNAHDGEKNIIDPDLVQKSEIYANNIQKLKDKISSLSTTMNAWSMPFFSPRYIGHMCMEMSLPAIMGWITAIMFNPNNVAFEASPVTTIIETEVGNDLCKMLGFNLKANPAPWGHITSDGTVANAESMWAARNLKYYPLAVYLAIVEGDLMFIREEFKVKLMGPKGQEEKLLKDLTSWELLNLPTNEIFELNNRLHKNHGISSKFLDSALAPYLVQTIGKEKLFERLGIDLRMPPQYLISSTRHYSWPKSAALLGIGSENCHDIPVDNLARIDTIKLRAMLDEKLARKQAVYAVVAIVGSTEEGVVDPVDRIVAMRDEYAKKGLTFIVHADAAWGGYFASMLHDPTPEEIDKSTPQLPETRFFESFMRQSIVNQFRALAHVDSISVDPHKAGYIPYPAGALCYRDGRMRFLLTWSAPYLHDSTSVESIGVYGIEGSKPGAAAVACHLHHQVVGLHKQGHGGLLGQVSFTCRRFSAHWATMSTDDSPYIVVPFNPLVNEGDVDKERKEKDFIRKRILDRSNLDLLDDEDAMKELLELGSDLNINAFACNFRIKYYDENGKLKSIKVNEDIEDANYLNKRIFARFSVTKPNQNVLEYPLFLSSTVFGEKDYGNCLRNYQRRLGLQPDVNSPQDLFVLRNVVMSPFQCIEGYPRKIAEAFLEGLQKETEVAIERATISPQKHFFTVQGHSRIYLVYHPYFHKANGRSQLILSAEIEDSNTLKAYHQVQIGKRWDTLFCETKESTTLDRILQAGRFSATIKCLKSPDVDLKVDFKINRVVKHRGLESRWRDSDYPKSTVPFYLYGTPKEMHIEHMLLRAPNVQVTVQGVTFLGLEPKLTEQQLEKGVIMHIKRPERALQPPSNDNDPEEAFKPDAQFDVFITDDVHPVQCHGPGLAEGGQELATGTVKLSHSIYVDWKDDSHLNREDFVEGPKEIQTPASRYASREIRKEWKKFVLESMKA